MDIALPVEGLNRNDIQLLETDFDCDHGKLAYEIEFMHNYCEYDYEVNATTGEVIYGSAQNSGDAHNGHGAHGGSNAQQNGYITANEALQIALNEAGVSESEAVKKHSELEDGSYYKVEFTKGDLEYEYFIDAQSGEILHSKSEHDD